MDVTSSKDFKTLTDKVNSILMEWDPIGVGDDSKDALKTEYANYAPEIVRIIIRGENLEKYLEDLLTETIGVFYIPSNKEHKDDLLRVIQKFIRAIKA